MEFIDLVKERYSCKSFKDEKVSKEIIEKILEIGSLAPTAKNSQPQKVYVLDSENAIKAVDNATPCRYNAQTVLAVCYDTTNVYKYPEGDYDSGVEDATIVATHLMLAAKSLGVDSCWLNFVKVDQLKKELGLPENEQIVMLLDLGYPQENFKPLENHYTRKSLSETTKWL